MVSQQNITNSQEWKDCLQYISRRLTEQSFNTWFKPTKGELNGQGEFKVAVPNQFVADWIRSHFGGLIDEAFEEALGRRFEVVYVATNDNGYEEQKLLDLNGDGKVDSDREATVARRPIPNNCNLNPKYDFDSLVVGDFNQFACEESHICHIRKIYLRLHIRYLRPINTRLHPCLPRCRRIDNR